MSYGMVSLIKNVIKILMHDGLKKIKKHFMAIKTTQKLTLKANL